MQKAERIDVICATAEAAWPSVRMDRTTFLAYCAKHENGALLDPDLNLNPNPNPNPNPESIAELWICAALSNRVPNAATAFDQRYFTSLPSALARLRLADHEVDELVQSLRMKLLVAKDNDADGGGGGGRLLIEGYAGKGKLAGFIKVAATREAVSRFRRRSPGDAQPDAFDPEMIFLPASSTDPGLHAVKAAARGAFREGLAIAFQSLEPRERNLLRLHLLGGVTLERLATMHGAHRATVVRWLRDARERVLERTRTELRERLGVRPDEVDSLMGLATSHLDLTLERLLRSEAGGEEEEDPSAQ